MLHVGLAAALLMAPPPGVTVLPGVITVDLVSLPGAEPSPALVAQEPEPVSPPPEPVSPPPEPAPPPPKPPPVIQNKPVVLPEKPTQPAVPKEPKPKPRARPEPRPEQPEAVEYDDLLAKLRAERGEARPDQVARAPAASDAPARASGGASRGVRVRPEVAAWLRRARIHVRHAWVLPPGFRHQPLQAEVRVRLDAQGKVMGQPKITRRSGNPWYDDSVVRAVQKASPLPAPPEAGEWPFVFRPEDLW